MGQPLLPNTQGADGGLSPALLQQLFAAAGVASSAAAAPPPPAPAASGSAALSLQAQQAALASAGSSLGSGQWVAVPGAAGALPVVPPAALSPAQVQSIQDQLSQLQQSGSLSSGSLSLQLGSGPLPSMALPAMAAPLPAGAQLPAVAGGAAAAKATKTRQKRPYKPPEVVQAERKQKAEVQVRSFKAACGLVLAFSSSGSCLRGPACASALPSASAQAGHACPPSRAAGPLSLPLPLFLPAGTHTQAGAAVGARTQGAGVSAAGAPLTWGLHRLHHYTWRGCAYNQ